MRVRRHLGLSGAGIAVTFSLLGHAGVALFAARHRGVATSSVVNVQAALPVPDADFVTAEDDDSPQPSVPGVAAVQPVNAAPRAVIAHSIVQAAAPTSTSAASSPTATADAKPAAVASSVVQDSTGPRFAMTVAPTIGAATGIAVAGAPSSGSGSSSSALAGGSGLGPIPAANADIPAKLRAGNVPSYTAAALAAGIEANVPLEIVVSESGIVVSARVLEHVGYGLDEAARQGVLAYRFTPAMRGGKPAAVRMQWLMRFQLR